MSTLGRIPNQIVDKAGNLTETAKRWFYDLFLRVGAETGDRAPSNGTYITNTPNSDLTGEQALSLLDSGFVKVTTGSGVLTSTGYDTIQASNLANTAVTAGSYTVNGVAAYTVDAQGRLTSSASPVITITGTANKITVSGGTGSAPTVTIASTYVGQSSITTLGTIVTGTWNGTTIDNAYLTNTAVANLSGTNTGDQTTVSGNAGSATTTAITDDTTTNATMYPTWVTTTTGNLAQKVSSTKLTFNPSTATLTTTTFSGALSGNATTVTTNANLTGVVTSTGNATIFATMTANNVLLGNGTATPQVVAPSTSGNVLTSNGTTWISSAAGASSKVINRVSTMTGTFASGTTVMVLDNSKPQSGEGVEFMTLAITPSNTANILVIDVVANLTVSVAAFIIAAIYQDSGADALASTMSYQTPGDTGDTISMRWIMAAGTTSATTFKFRAGGDRASTIRFNGDSVGGYFNGTFDSSIMITEYSV